MYVWLGILVHVCMVGYTGTCMYGWVYWYMYVWLGILVHVCMVGYTGTCMYGWVYWYMYVWLGILVHVCMAGYTGTCMYGWVYWYMYVWLDIRACTRTYVCMVGYTCTYGWICPSDEFNKMEENVWPRKTRYLNHLSYCIQLLLFSPLQTQNTKALPLCGFSIGLDSEPSSPNE